MKGEVADIEKAYNSIKQYPVFLFPLLRYAYGASSKSTSSRHGYWRF